MRDKYISVDYALRTANLPSDIDNLRYDLTGVYELLVKYYQKYSELEPEIYSIESDSSKKITSTTLARSGNDLDITRISPMESNHSNYTKDGLESVGIDINDSWNGDSSTIIYDDGVIRAGKSDYFTSITIARILFLEAVQAYIDNNGDVENISKNDLPFRSSYLTSYDDFISPHWVGRTGTVGGLIIANTGDSWEMILGNRSENTDINPNRISITPNGGIHYDTLSESGFVGLAKKHFMEELFSGQSNPKFFDKYVKPYMVSTGWNIRDGTFTVGYMLVIDSEQGYNTLVNRENHNFEFDKIKRVDVQDSESILKIANMRNMSPTAIPTVYRSLASLESVSDIGLPYSVLQKR